MNKTPDENNKTSAAAFSAESLSLLNAAITSDPEGGGYDLSPEELSIRYGGGEGMDIFKDEKGYRCTRHRERSADLTYLENESAAVECFLKEIEYAMYRWENDEYPYGRKNAPGHQ